MFTKRNAALNKEIQELQKTEKELLEQQETRDLQQEASLQIVPVAQHILGNYDQLSTVEKNQLWKLVLKKVTIYRSQEDKVSLNIYPNLPK